MRVARPLIVVSCPGRTLSDVAVEIESAVVAGADLAEVRLDRLDPECLPRLGVLFPARIPLVGTLRSRAEGGEGPDSSAERGRQLTLMAGLPFQFLDVERARDDEFIERTSASVSPRLIVSSHVHPSASPDEIRALLDLPRPPGAVGKVVVPCSLERLWAEILPAVLPLDRFAPCVLHTTGNSGPILRAWAWQLGMFAVFSALPDRNDGAVQGVEPTQIPADRLRTYFEGETAGPLFAVVGHPIAHSRSPAVHSFWFRREGRNGLYLALDVESPEEFASTLGPLASGGFRGLNVTHPWKQVALSLSSRAGPAAELAACANTLTFDGGEVSAENTDVAAVRRRLVELRNAGKWDGSPVVVLGAGGAARSALAAVQSLGSTSIVVARRPQVATELARQYNARAVVPSALGPADLVIHATPAGREGTPPLELAWDAAVNATTHVLDFVYAPADGFLQTGAEARGATYEDGSRLLVYQAAESYALWWGSPPSTELQEEALREVLCTG